MVYTPISRREVVPASGRRLPRRAGASPGRGEELNWYKHHLGDYDSHTAHLSWDEDLAYTRLLRAYYRTESPIPAAAAYRLTRATTIAQRAAVDAVLQEFFTFSPGPGTAVDNLSKSVDNLSTVHSPGPRKTDSVMPVDNLSTWHNKRADEEIALYKSRCEINRLTGKMGGRPKTESVPQNNRFGSTSVSPNNPSQNQIPEGLGLPATTKKPTNSLCASLGCPKPGIKSRSINGQGRWYCADHYDSTQGPRHISDLIDSPTPTSTDIPF